MAAVRYAVAPDWSGGGAVRPLSDDGVPLGPAERVEKLADTIRDREALHSPRWVWADTSAVYPILWRAGVRVERCHDLALTESLLSGHHGRWGEPRALGAAWARLRGEPIPEDAPPLSRESQPSLFEPDRTNVPDGVDPLDAMIEVHAAQVSMIAALPDPRAFGLLAAAESASALVAVEMGHIGLPWRVDAHNALLTELLGPRPSPGVRPPQLAELAERISAAFGGRRMNPDAPADVVRAFDLAGISVPSTRSWVLKQIDHPAVPVLLQYKELSRLHTAHGWAWQDAWVHDGRFRPEYVVGGVVSGRWATRGGGALQIPRIVRRAVVADPQWTLVVADASQLEPRILAALSDDRRMAEAARGGDLYAGLAAEAFDGDRGRAKVAVLAAMYGQTSGEAGQLLAALRQRFPAALGHVEAAARIGEDGGLVRSRLGRTCPPATAQWRATAEASVLRDRGRFTRNFVVQASAADWAATMLAVLRRLLASSRLPAELVFFQHDEVIVHCPTEVAPDVASAVREAGAEAGRLVFGDTPVLFPLDTKVVTCYADAK